MPNNNNWIRSYSDFIGNEHCRVGAGRRRSNRFCRLLAVLGIGLWLLAPAVLHAQRFEPNYDEAKVPDYQLPSIIDEQTDQAQDFPLAWQKRRAQVLQVFAEQMYGVQPASPFQLEFEKVESGPSCGGKALRQQWRVSVSTNAGSQTIDLLIFTPADATQPVPCFLGLNFSGNHTVAADPEIPVTQSWVRNNDANFSQGNRASEQGRGTGSSRWPVEQIVSAGCGVATAYYGDIDPDTDDDFRNGVHALFPEHRPSSAAPQRWGSISAWAWGLSRLLDCIEREVQEIDSGRVAVIGHSRLGKTALWAGATDTRFACVISNNSGCGGAALSRRAVGETVTRINTSFPHWFCPNFKQYNDLESELPIDQHQLIALIAPRLTYVASATQDQWADPHGEFLSLHLASEVFARLPHPADRPEAPIHKVGYHLRDGQHDINSWDWAHYLRFLKQL